MKTYSSKLLILFSSVAALTFFACNDKKTDPLQEALNKLQASHWMSYSEEAYYPIPDTELVDTLNFEVEIVNGIDDSLGYNYIMKAGDGDYIFQENKLRVINHKNRLTRIFLPDHFEEKKDFKKIVEQYSRIKYSPQTLLKKAWYYKADTIIDNSKLYNYSKIDREGIHEGQKFRVEHHIFINSKTALLERFERRYYVDGNLNQCVVNRYLNFKLSQNPVTLAYNFPTYTSVYDPEKKQEGLKVGEQAPPISGVDLDGNAINLKDFRGEKVLLNFSVIGCGACKMALDHINKADYRFTEKVKVLYINPEDNENRMKKFMERFPIPFPIIAGASEIGDKYRVSGYPSYFLIDEEGRIDQIKIGYSEEFIDEFRQ
ncbi:MAG: TlpA family protein disulfide reductase [Flammeovirgaceae bacterium]|nr:TlpA family protein disulfide reductase [Flammeovirgaceae bacterium]